MELECAGISDVGRRKNNEDRLLAEPELGLFVVADGMGGYEGGEVASRLVVETMAEFFRRNADDGEVTWPFGLAHDRSFLENLVTVGLRAANRQVIAHKTGTLSSMGSTAVVLALGRRSAVLGHVGDSRIYRLRRGSLEQMTVDHSLAAELARAGRPPLPDGRFSHVVTRAIGVPDASTPEVREVEVEEGDTFLLCSDGLTDPLDDEALEGALRRLPPEGACRALIEAALEAGGQDNVTALVLTIGRLDQLDSSMSPWRRAS